MLPLEIRSLYTIGWIGNLVTYIEVFTWSLCVDLLLSTGGYCASVNDARIVRGAILSLCCEVGFLFESNTQPNFSRTKFAKSLVWILATSSLKLEDSL